MSKSKPLFFFGKTKKHGYMSQFYISLFQDSQGINFTSCEMFMMYSKAILFEGKNSKTALKILEQVDPKEIKKLGRKVTNFDQSIWDKTKNKIVFQGNMLKFSQNKTIRQFLLETGDRHLVEASPYDKIWGIGISSTKAKKMDPSEWPGQNLLGKAIMKCRKKLSLK